MRFCGSAPVPRMKNCRASTAFASLLKPVILSDSEESLVISGFGKNRNESGKEESRKRKKRQELSCFPLFLIQTKSRFRNDKRFFALRIRRTGFQIESGALALQ